MKSLSQMRPVYIAGVSMSKWGFYPEIEFQEYGAKTVFDCLRDAGMTWDDVQAVFSGSVYLGTASGHKIVKDVGMNGIPVVNIENACSSSASALRLAYHQVAAEIYDVVLVIGVEKNPKGPIASNAFRPWELQLGFNLQPANYALEAKEYMHSTGCTEQDISMVTVKNRKNASMNPNARMQTPVTLQEVMSSRMIATPLRLLHCCPLADGAAVAIVCSKDKLKDVGRAIKIAACVLTSSPYGDEYVPAGLIGSAKFPSKINGATLSAQQAYELSGIGPRDIDIAQLYDTVSIGELWDAECMGFCGKGEAPKLLREGHFDITGKLPVNTDGGLMGRGHPMGATGLGQIFEVVAQLRGEAGPRQVKKARVGLAHAMGAGPNSSLTILTK